MFGYQGWFLTSSDGNKVGWRHWSRNTEICNGSSVTFDLWPDTSEYESNALENTNMHYANGDVARLFSSTYSSVTNKHFEWLRDYKLDGVFLQRFLGEIKDPNFFRIRNQVTMNIMNASVAYGRTWAIMYDISGANPDTFIQDIKNDWTYLSTRLSVTHNPMYQNHNSKPVVSIWGFGFTDRLGTVEQTLDVIQFFKDHNCYVIGGVPFYWREGKADSKPDFMAAYAAFDALSPWSVGRYQNPSSYDKLFHDVVVQDKALTYQHDMFYAPVVWPGFSWHNLFPKSPQNTIPRNELKRDKTFIYIAMFDEVDEGTAMFKAASAKSSTPVDGDFLYLSIDGVTIPSDHYLSLAGNITQQFKI
jgi:hypothetical protein